MVTWTMNDNARLTRIIKQDLDVRADDETFRTMRETVLEAHGRPKETRSAPALISTRRLAMKNPITKLAVAATIIAAAVLGLFEFIDTGSTSGIVWADIARKLEASRGVTFRIRDVAPDSQEGGPDYRMIYLDGTRWRNDTYLGDQVIKTVCFDFNTKTSVLVNHSRHSYWRKMVEGQEQTDLWRDPRSVVQGFLSQKHRKLKARTVEGVLCEGLETTNPAFLGGDYPAERLTARLWVSVETGYPVQIEAYDLRDNGKIRNAVVADQFQWDVELSESLFEPVIPEDYVESSPDK